MSQNLRQAIRALIRRPGFTALVVLITALCIGGITSVFSIAKAVLFQDLPYPDSDRLVQFSLRFKPTGAENDLSYLEVLDFKQRTTLFEGISPFIAWQTRLLRVGDAYERIGVQFAGPGHLRLLGVTPHLGRLFTPEESNAPGSAPVTLLSYELWQKHFSGDPDVIGKAVTMNGNTYTVVGILPAGHFDIAEGTWEVDAWLPAVMANDAYRTNILERREFRTWQALGRLKPGVSHDAALAELESIAQQLVDEYPDTNKDYGAQMMSLRRFMYGDLQPSMQILYAGAILILLVGCANIAGLLLVRMVDRRTDLAMQLALGASRWHLVRQVFVESLTLALMGGALGVALALWGINLLSSWVEAPPFAQMGLDGFVLGVVLVTSALTGILFGLPPAFGAARMEARQGLAPRSRNPMGGGLQGSKSRSTLLVFQVAVVTALLVVAGLLLRSFLVLRDTGVGFNTDRLLVLHLSFSSDTYRDRQNISTTERELLRRLETMPGIESAMFWGSGTPGIFTLYMTIQPEGALDTDAPLRANIHSTSPGAVTSLGFPLLQGRDLEPTDSHETQRVALVTRSLAETLWPGEDPMGKRIQRFRRPDEPVMEIVGIVADNKLHDRFADGNDHQLFVSVEQRPSTQTSLVVRTSAPTEAIIDEVREEIRRIDPEIPVYEIQTMDQLLYDGERSHLFNAAVVGMYGLLALAFAALGLYGVLAYSVLQRTQEIGVRMAFGARPNDILKGVVGRGFLLTGLGMFIGLIGAFAGSRLLSSLLYQISERDPITFVSVVAILTVVTALATLVPALRALRIEPTEALRFE